MDWFLDGAEVDSVPVSDRGFQYGDGLFETIAVRGGGPRFLDEHLQRLTSGLERLGIEPDAAVGLADEVRRVVAGCAHGIAKVIVTRGSGPRGYRSPPDAVPRRLVGVVPSEPVPRGNYDPGIALRICRTPIGARPATAGMKTLGRLDQIIARDEWRDPDVAEGLMLDARGRIVCGTMTNFFCVRDERLLTPSLAEAGVAGIMRRIVIEQAPMAGFDVSKATLRIEDIRDEDELFVTNSQIGIWPVRRFGERALGRAERTRRLMERLASIGVEECAL